MVLIFSSIFVGLNILDLVETKVALANGFIELNPIANFMFSIGFAEIFKAVTTITVLLCFYFLYKINSQLAIGLSFILSIFLSSLVIWNWIQLF
ncbi:MAG: DUF5658 family protein [Candidatus Jordarchaeum sp.]|uniref:DUF5658 family protein n=1 Tax=Candidatus Jordarchaeum sp. TaxID=2823881 RepID=UPI00404B28DA